MRERTGGDAHQQARDCARAADLVAFLYGEAEPAAARDFQTHLRACAVCRDEVAAFGVVRARVGEWRAEVLGDAPALGLSGAFTPAAHAAPERARSARAAVREFFALAPPWLRAGACATLLVVCGLAALAVARTQVRWNADGLAFTAGVPERVVNRVERIEVPVTAAHDESRVEAMVEERVRAALAAARTRAAEPETLSAQSRPRLAEAASKQPPKRIVPRPARRVPRRLEDEESLPRLSDLLSSVY